MIFFSVGLPGWFAEFCDALTLRLAEQNLGATSHGAFNTLDDIARAAIRSQTPHLVAGLRQPVVRLQTEIVQSGRPFLVTLGDVYAAVGELARHPGYDQIAATREVASSCAAILTLMGAPNALVLSSEHARDPFALALAIARHFGLPGGEAMIAEIAASIAINTKAEAAETGEPDDVVVRGAVGPYVKLFREGGVLDSIVWEPDLFFARERGEEDAQVPARGAIDVTGRARCLIFGPYINLAPGSWAASVAIGFSAEVSGVSFFIDVYAGVQLGHTRVQPEGEEVIETNLSFTIPLSLDHPVEIRIMSERAAFDGRIALGHVRLTHRRDNQTEAERRLIASLHR